MTQRTPLFLRRVLASSIMAATLAFLSPTAMREARAEILQLSATGFASRVPNGTEGAVGQGMLQNATGKHYATVPFPINGRRVCRFSLIYRDFDVDHNITARLMRKAINIGGSAFNAPVVMAAVSSSGAVDTMRRATTTTVARPVIANDLAIYFVELEFPFDALQAVGVQIDHRATCP